MKRYFWEFCVDKKVGVFDERRGRGKGGSLRSEAALAVCDNAADAQLVVDALNEHDRRP